MGSSKSNTIFTVATPSHADHVVHLHLAARADAEIAVDAGVEVDRHGGMTSVGLRPVRGRKTALLTAHSSAVSQKSGTPGRARCAGRLVGQQQLDHHLRAILARSVSVLTFMPAVGGRMQRRGQHALALDLDHAGAAVAVGAVARLGA